ncbi:MAG: hypothetical protein JSW08_02410 [archaeon]|nr:MAG: hypothetical protein JSW08_02410 [archaeon]
MDKAILICVVLSVVLVFLFAMAYADEGFFSFVREKPSPSNWIRGNEIEVQEDRVIINLKNAVLTSYSNTNSMDPLIDEDTNGIEIKPMHYSQIKVGDIIAFNQEEKVIVHRVTNTGTDEGGWFCKVKGDNGLFNEKIRFSQIVGVVVMLIY